MMVKIEVNKAAGSEHLDGVINTKIKWECLQQRQAEWSFHVVSIDEKDARVCLSRQYPASANI